MSYKERLKEDKTIAKIFLKVEGENPAITAFFASAFFMEEIKDVLISEWVFVGFCQGFFFPFLHRKYV